MVRIDQCVDGVWVRRDLLRRQFVNVADTVACIGEERASVGRPPVLEDETRHLVGQVRDQVDRLLELLARFPQLCDIDRRADHAQRAPVAVALITLPRLQTHL